MSTAPPAPRERAAAAPASSPEPSLPEGALGMRSGPEPQLAERALGRESSGSAPRPISVATANLHAGVDGWGRPFPAVERCLELDTDILFLQESWADDGSPSLARQVAERGGYEIAESVLASGRRREPGRPSPSGWGPSPRRGRRQRALLLGTAPSSSPSSGGPPRPAPPGTAAQPSRRLSAGEPARRAPSGSWGIAVLSRVPVRAKREITLRHLPRDVPRRVGLAVDVELGPGQLLTVIGTHLGHLTHGSALQLADLRRGLPAPTEPALLGGDMNCWGPPLLAALPGWRRAVRGRTWPAWRPHSQLDHLLVTRPVRVLAGHVAPPIGSDHRPVVAVISLLPAGAPLPGRWQR